MPDSWVVLCMMWTVVCGPAKSPAEKPGRTRFAAGSFRRILQIAVRRKNIYCKTGLNQIEKTVQIFLLRDISGGGVGRSDAAHGVARAAKLCRYGSCAILARLLKTVYVAPVTDNRAAGKKDSGPAADNFFISSKSCFIY